mgnify:CR=1 FL=1
MRTQSRTRTCQAAPGSSITYTYQATNTGRLYVPSAFRLRLWFLCHRRIVWRGKPVASAICVGESLVKSAA